MKFSEWIFTFILGLLLGAAAAFITVNNQIQNLKQDFKFQKAGITEDLNSAQSQITTLSEDLLLSRALLDLTRSNYKLIYVLVDAGYDISSRQNFAKIVDESYRLPVGSPFASPVRLTSQYGLRNELVLGGSAGGHHPGIDIVPTGRDWTIYVTAPGEIIDFGETETLGKYIVFQTDTGYVFKYGHLDKIYWQNARTGQVKGIPLSPGTRLGLMGATGTWCLGAHLHLELRKINPDGTLTELDPFNVITIPQGVF